MNDKLYQTLASKAQAMRNCAATKNTEWEGKHEQAILDLVKEHLPSGSGFDSGTNIELDECNDSQLVFSTSFHHMDEHGGYDGWTEHKVVVKPSFAGIDIKVTGRDRNQIKEYIGDIFYGDLTQLCI